MGACARHLKMNEALYFPDTRLRADTRVRAAEDPSEKTVTLTFGGRTEHRGYTLDDVLKK